jgi:hypothetical protein
LERQKLAWSRSPFIALTAEAQRSSVMVEPRMESRNIFVRYVSDKVGKIRCPTPIQRKEEKRYFEPMKKEAACEG